ncbi:hypothetical protein AGMMS49991_05790 [Spirochaetia bacterium]|nr:hypothetical protein AGMMS49991_05790 [Spirochaetia bacterium]
MLLPFLPKSVVLASGVSAPTAAAIKAASSGIHGTASALAAENTIAVTGLTAASTNTAYIVVEDTAGNLSTVLTITGVNPVVPPSLPAYTLVSIPAGTVTCPLLRTVAVAGVHACAKFSDRHAARAIAGRPQPT